MSIRSVLKTGLDRGRELVEEIEDRAGTRRARERQEYKAWEEQRAREEAREQRQEESANRFPQTVEAFGGRVALVTNFSPEWQAEQIGHTIAEALTQKGFESAGYIVVDGMVSPGVSSRFDEFDQSRSLLVECLRERLPDVKFSSNMDFLDEKGLTLGVFTERLERTIDLRDARWPDVELGFVAVLSAFDIGPVYDDCRYGGVPYTNDEYEKVRYGGVLVPNSDNNGWEQIVSGN